MINTWINNFKPSQIKIWEPLHKHYPKFSFEKLPSKLKDIKEIKIGDLINKLKELDTVTMVMNKSLFGHIYVQD